ncbi:HEAT repeat domain-containing protein [Streptomyces sp. NPDC002057]|uniref:HEAT repeat domain-containing protein n=1 Tax=Streptomyces sp. NPDC002057 TaxID=3154664 RepID=UPI0033319D89
MTMETHTVRDVWARTLLVDAGVDPSELRLDVPEQVDRGIALAMSGFDSNRSELVAGAVSIAWEIMRRWRTPRPELVAGLVRVLESSEFHARGDAAMVLARLVSPDSTQDVTSAVPALIAAADDSFDRVAGPAALALARLGRPEVLDPVHRWLASSSGLPFFQVTSLGEVLHPLVGRADALLPGIRRTLLDSADTEGLRPVLTTLAAWGPAASETVPELVSALATRNVRWACDTLGGIGPAAAPAASTLESLLRGITRPPRHDGSAPLPHGVRRWHGARNAAWAHWRITGESRLFLAFLEDAASRGLGYASLSRLAELGPEATRFATAVRPLLESPGPWTRVQAAHAWWRITGDPDAAVPVLLAALEPLRSGDADEPCIAAVRYIARIGAPALAAAPLLEATLTSDRRFPEDVRSAARTALATFGDGRRIR